MISNRTIYNTPFVKLNIVVIVIIIIVIINKAIKCIIKQLIHCFVIFIFL